MYVLNVLSALDVCCIQVFHVARVSCCSKYQGRRGIGRSEPVGSGRGAQHTGADGRGHDGAGCTCGGRANGWGWGRGAGVQIAW